MATAVQPCPEAAALLIEFFESFRRRDPDGISATLSEEPSTLVAGTDPVEVWHGAFEPAATLLEQIEFLKSVEGVAVYRYGPCEAWSERGIAWGFLQFESYEPDHRWIPLRASAVFRLERGTWKIVQLHHSLGLTNEDAFGRNLPTSLDHIVEAIHRDPPNLHPVADGDGTVTIVFTDIEESTRLNLEMGDEAWMGLLQAHDALIRTAATEHHGLEVKHQGDGFMIAFAFPEAAAAFAIQVQRALAGRKLEGHSVRVRIGAHRGKAMSRDDDFFGSTVAYAARVAAMARGGEILMSEDTSASLPRAQKAEIIDVELKGFEGRNRLRRISWQPD